MSKSVAEILDAAADLIEPEGAWMQGGLNAYRDGVPYCWCALGALIHVGGAFGWSILPMVEAALPDTNPGGLRPIAAFNDAPERTQAEVVAKLREAAAKAREAGK